MKLVIALMSDEAARLVTFPEGTMCQVLAEVDARLLLDSKALIAERLEPATWALRRFYVEAEGIDA